MQHLDVPPGIESDPIIRKHELALLKLRQAMQFNDRHFREPKLSSCLQPTVPGNQRSSLADKQRIDEAECSDTACDFRELRFTMRTRVAGRRDDVCDRPELQPQ